jgi:hypothetical protein
MNVPPDPGRRFTQERGSLVTLGQIALRCNQQGVDSNVSYTLAMAVVQAGYPKSKFFSGYSFEATPIIGPVAIRTQTQGFTSGRGPATTPDSLSRMVFGVPVAEIKCLVECHDPTFDRSRRFQMFSAARTSQS